MISSIDVGRATHAAAIIGCLLCKYRLVFANASLCAVSGAVQ